MNLHKEWNRRQFLQFIGKNSALLSGFSVLPASCMKSPKVAAPIKNLAPSLKDDVRLVEDLRYSVLVSWGDPISKTHSFGFNCDYINYVPLSKNNKSLFFMVNNEYPNDKYVSGYLQGKKTKTQADKEQQSVGCSLFKADQVKHGQWKVDTSYPYNRRIDAQTKIPFAGGQAILNRTHAVGTLGNCAGGKTPWNTFLSCEENYQDYYGERDPKTGKINKDNPYYASQWEDIYAYPPEHYGWVVEIDPLSSDPGKKLTSLGRFAHESATVTQAKDGRPVVYMGDDKENEFIYKFIADKTNSLETGTLYVADTNNNQWLPLTLNNTKLKQSYKSQLDILIHAREAARMIGATPQDRPEDVELDQDGNIYIALTKNGQTNNPHGSILKMTEDNNDPLSLSFKHETFIAGGEKTGFACPDNIEFDPKGNLWFTTDISGHKVGKGDYKAFGNNGLFVVLKEGPQAGMPIQVASAPIDAEFTGPKFSPDGKTLFLSVQHPGEMTQELDKPTSHWPDGGNSKPKPSVICIAGKFLDKISAV
ncbi:DUF839 domain-containing protein [bacterium]|nr:DUF839 domain-containing protein [bacterium]